MKRLDPKAIWLFYSSWIIGLVFMAILFVWIFEFTLRDLPLDEIRREFQVPGIILFIINNWWFILLLLALLGYAWSYLSWYYYKYELTEDGFRKEMGILWKKYVSIPYERIQNVDIYRGLFARILGLSDLQIQTAGMSTTVGRFGTTGAGAEGRLPGVTREEAEKLRDELIKKTRGKKDQGV